MMKSKIPYLLPLILLLATNVWLEWRADNKGRENLQLRAMIRSQDFALKELNTQSDALRTNCTALIKGANKTGFSSALFGFAAAQQGMDPASFLVLATKIYSGTNTVDVHIDILGTNVNDVDDIKLRRRL
jgi:hypothetical protein